MDDDEDDDFRWTRRFSLIQAPFLASGFVSMIGMSQLSEGGLLTGLSSYQVLALAALSWVIFTACLIALYRSSSLFYAMPYWLQQCSPYFAALFIPISILVAMIGLLLFMAVIVNPEALAK